MDAALHTSGNYVTSYGEKTAKFLEMDTISEGLKRAARDALSFRLEPRPVQWDATIWFMARDHLLSSLMEFSGGVNNGTALARKHWRNRFGSLTHLLKTLVSGSIPDFSCRAVECAEMLLLASANSDFSPPDPYLMSDTIGYLHKSAVTCSRPDWKSVNEAVVSAWFRCCHV